MPASFSFRGLLPALGLGLFVLAAACGSETTGASTDTSPTSGTPTTEGDASAPSSPPGALPGTSDGGGPSCTSTCTEGAVQCSATANGTSRCTRQPSGCSDWAATAPCAAGQVCSGGACVGQCTNQCTVGTKICSGSGVATCEMKPTGCTDWSTPAACGDGKTCSGGACASSCTNQCAAGAKQCAGVGNGIATCVVKPSGCTDWDTPAPCGDGKTCSGASCVSQCANQCTLGAKQCAGVANGVATCVTKASGCTDWDTPVACNAGTICSGGSCLAQCVNQCTAGAKQCTAGGVATCEVKPSGCTDWSPAAACSGGQVCAGGVCQGGGPVTWKSIVSPTNQTLRKVWGTSANDVFAVGDGGTIVHWDGAAWSAMASGTVSDLRGLWGTSATNVYAAGGTQGAPTTLLRYDGAKWSVVSSPAFVSASSFWDVFGTGPNDVWVVGASPAPNGLSRDYVARWNGNAWTVVSGASFSTGGLTGYSGAAGDAWVVDWSSYAAHLENGAWTKITTINGGFSGVVSVSGSARDNVFFVTSNSRIQRWDGQAFSSLTSPYQNAVYNGVFIRSANEGLAVANAGRIITWNGAAWAIDTRAQNIGTPTLLGVWANGPSDAWTVGANGTILRLAP